MSDKQREAYKAMHKACGLKVGDTVRVVRKAKDQEWGWSVCWGGENASRHIGKQHVIDADNGRDGFHLGGWNFPFFVLELVEPAEKLLKTNGDEHTIKLNTDGSVSVGFTGVSASTMKELWKRWQAIKDD